MNLLGDIVFGLRSLRRSPAFALVAVLTLALGIGANTALFSVVNAVLLRGFGYADPARLVEIWGINKKGQPTGVGIPDWKAFQSRAHSFREIGVSRLQTFTVNGPHEPENLFGQMVSREPGSKSPVAKILPRSSDIRGCAGRADLGGVGSGLFAGAAGNAGGPDGGPPGGVTAG